MSSWTPCGVKALNRSLRAVFDPGVLVSAAITPSGTSCQALKAERAKGRRGGHGRWSMSPACNRAGAAKMALWSAARGIHIVETSRSCYFEE